jgi:hypothetical protein
MDEFVIRECVVTSAARTSCRETAGSITLSPVTTGHHRERKRPTPIASNLARFVRVRAIAVMSVSAAALGYFVKAAEGALGVDPPGPVLTTTA